MRQQLLWLAQAWARSALSLQKQGYITELFLTEEQITIKILWQTKHLYSFTYSEKLNSNKENRPLFIKKSQRTQYHNQLRHHD